MSKSYDPQGDAGMDSVQEQFRGETDGEDAHMELHIYEGDSAFVVRENGNKSLYGVQLPELRALFNDARTADGGPAPAVSEAEVEAALGAWRAAPGLGVNKAIMRICLEAAQRARK